MSAAAPDRSSRSNSLQLIGRAADVLRALRAAPDGLTLSEIATSVALAKSTTHRLLAALEAEDFLGADARGRYRLGRGLAQLGAAARGVLRQDLQPLLVRLAHDIDETVDLSILEGSEVRFIDQIPSAHRLRAVSAIGVSFPLHCTANGKALLVALDAAHAEAILPARLSKETQRTITSRRELSGELERIREAGYAVDRGEHTDGICAVGAVVRDAYGIAGAISIPVPTTRFLTREPELVRALLASVAEADALLGAGN